MGECCCRAVHGKYPAELPPGTQLPAGVEILSNIKDAEAIAKCVDIAAQSFAGTAVAPPPGEFDWMLYEFPDRTNENHRKERLHRMTAFMSLCVHYTFILKSRGLILISRAEETNGSKGKITGCIMLSFYPQGWSANVDGRCSMLQASMNSGAGSWSEAQNAFMTGKRLQALDIAVVNLKKKHAVKLPHIVVQVVGVDPDCQGEGIGKKLLNAAHAIAEGLKLACYLEVDAGSKNEQIYKKFGYRTMGTEEMKVKQKEDTDESFAPGLSAMIRNAPA